MCSRASPPPSKPIMARYSVNDILKFLDEEECINDVVTNESDDELDCEDDRYATVMLYNVNIIHN